MSQWHTGILGMGLPPDCIPNDFPHTLAGELTKAGYQTHLQGKAHFTPQNAKMGFESAEFDEAGRIESPDFHDDYRAYFAAHAPADVTPDDHGVGPNAWQARPWHTAEHLHPTAWTMTRSLEFLKRRDKNRPFFLHISFDRPHAPYVPPQAYWEMYFHQPIPPPAIGDWAAANDQPQWAVNTNAMRGNLGEVRTHRARAGYAGEITFIDMQVGRLMNYIYRYAPELAANTCFLFISDHGDMQGDQHLWRKSVPYEGSSRIPFLVMRPGAATSAAPARSVADEVVELRDVMPTILELAGWPCPSTVEGKSVVGLLQQPDPAWRVFLHGEHFGGPPDREMEYLTDGRRKFIWFPHRNVEHFFDLESDPHELHDLIGDVGRQAEIALWRERLVQELSARDCGWVKNGKPFCPGDGPMISPWANQRWMGR
jgi:arylsulfatase A-like enzyme